MLLNRATYMSFVGVPVGYSETRHAWDLKAATGEGLGGAAVMGRDWRLRADVGPYRPNTRTKSQASPKRSPGHGRCNLLSRFTPELSETWRPDGMRQELGCPFLQGAEPEGGTHPFLLVSR